MKNINKNKKAYQVNFKGREIGAIGITYPCSVVVMATDKNQARELVYNTHEHCSNFDIKCIL